MPTITDATSQLRLKGLKQPHAAIVSYNGDSPNPHLRSFVRSHHSPYDAENDKYAVKAFTTAIETKRSTSIYNMHTYWSKKPHDAIRQYICHFTRPGDLVLDPFSGSGGTALAALMEGRNAVAVDRSPAAAFITKCHCAPEDPDALIEDCRKLLRQVQPSMKWLYGTTCDRCGGPATINYTIYSQVYQCPKCLSKVALWDCDESEGVTDSGKAKAIAVCPHCNAKGHSEEISWTAPRWSLGF